MSFYEPVHPTSLVGSSRYAPGAPIPAGAPVEVQRHNVGVVAWLDVFGGVCFAIFVSMIMMRVGAHLFTGGGWAPVIAWESIWLIAAILCTTVMPSGIQHDISIRSTIEGLKLDWPELVYATMTLGYFAAYIGGVRFEAGPLAMSLAVGVGEEFIFRVLLLGWLVTKLPAPHALVVSALVFGIAHLHELTVVGLLSIAPQTAGGFVLGAIYLRTRNPLGPIIAHAYWDFPYFMILGGGVSGGSAEGGMPTLMSLVPWIAFAIYGLWLVRDGIPLVGRHEPVAADCYTCAGTTTRAR